MIIYNGNFVSKIKCNGTDLKSVLSLSANNIIWESPHVQVTRNNNLVPSGSTISISRNTTYIDFDISFNVPLSQNRSGRWFRSPDEDQQFTVSDILYLVTEEVPNVVKSDWRIEFEENTEDARTGTLTLKDSLTGDTLWTCTFQQAGISWTTTSCTCIASPISYGTTHSNPTIVYTTHVTVESYASQTSSAGGSRTVAVTPTASISNTNIITGVSFTHVSGNTYRMTVNYKRNATGSSTVTITTSYGGKTDTATFRLIVSQPL